MRIRTFATLVVRLTVVSVLAVTIYAAVPSKAPPPRTPPPTIPLITRAIADDVGTFGQYVALVSFVTQVPTNSAEDVALGRRGKTLSQLHVWISGEEITDAEILSDTVVNVGGVVLVDVGAPVDPFTPKLDPAVSTWLHDLATARRGWTYRFVAGDHVLCRISGEFDDAAMINPDAALAAAVAARDPKDGQPLLHEEMSKMADLFTGPHASKLVVVGSKPPVWVPRELTEWLSRLPGEEAGADGASSATPRIDESRHRLLGREAQWAVTVGDGAALRELAEWIAAGLVVPVIVKGQTTAAPAASPPAAVKPVTAKPQQQMAAKGESSVPQTKIPVNDDPLPEAWRPLAHGVEDLFARARPIHSATEFLVAYPPASFREHRGVLRVPLNGLQRPASGAYMAEVALQSGGQLYRSRETNIIDRAATTWRPPLLWIYIFAIFLASLGVVSYLFLSHREKSELNSHHAAFSRNIAFGCAGGLFALCTSLVAESESLSLLTAASAFGCGCILLVLGCRFLVQHHRFEQAV